ncbi:hypothetical protein [Thaumasiovibrio sp. DFM-14]|uniref:hypothetical protein n=1 Tax=Thaumasiovibrio sp. DFM-14 TaxID=3384792 RepID=UPI00399EF3C9
MKKTLIAASLALVSASSFAFNEAPLAKHDLKIVSEHRDHFSRNYMELGSNFGMVGPGILMTTLEYHTWSKDNSKILGGSITDKDMHSVDSLYVPGFMYFIPVSKTVAIGPAAKYEFNSGYRSMFKAGIAGMYNPGNGFYGMAMYRFDRGMSSDVKPNNYDMVNMDRKDLMVGYKSAEWNINLRGSHFHFVESQTKQILDSLGHDGQFAEAELIAEYNGYNNFSPYVSAIWESTGKYMNPTAYGNSGFSVGVKLHF